jgi:hypothetical protein
MAAHTLQCLVCGRDYTYYDGAPAYFCSVSCEVDAGPVGHQIRMAAKRTRASSTLRSALDTHSAVPAPDAERQKWAKFSYPEDRERIPLITPEGKTYPHEIRGVFRRRGYDLLIQTEEGKEMTATMAEWTLAEADLDRLGGYILSGEVQDG